MPEKVFGGFDNTFYVYLMGGTKIMEEIVFSLWLFEGKLRLFIFLYVLYCFDQFVLLKKIWFQDS